MRSRRIPDTLRGIALIGEDITDKELRHLAESGVRGFRVNRTAKTGLAFDVARRLAERVKELGWHVQFLLDVDDHPDLDSMLGSFATEVVIDHMGRPDPRKGVDAPGFQALIRLLKSGRGWAKLSAPYRTSLREPPYPDMTPFAHALVAAAPDRLVWGSDWPHVLLEKTMPDDGDLVDADRGLGAGRRRAQAHPRRQRGAALRLRAGVTRVWLAGVRNRYRIYAIIAIGI